jgi:nitric oxide reductase large subunit
MKPAMHRWVRYAGGFLVLVGVVWFVIDLARLAEI